MSFRESSFEVKIYSVYKNAIENLHLGGKDLHLYHSGSNLFTETLFNVIEKCWKSKGCSYISCGRLFEFEHLFRPESASSCRRSNTSLTTGNKDWPIIAQLIINFLRNRFAFLSSEISKCVDILPLLGTTLNYLFPTAQFLLSDFIENYRLDHSSNGLVVEVSYIREVTYLRYS